MAQRKVTPFAKPTPWAPVSIPAADESTTDVDDVDRIRMIMAGVLGISEYHEIQVDTDFQSLGLDSLGSIEAQQALGVVLKISVLHDLFTNYTGWSFGGLVAFEAAQRLTARGLVVKGIVLIDSPGP